MSQRLTEPSNSDQWRDLRDANGKLYARLETRRGLLEIRRSDRDMIATFDLRDYLENMQAIESDEDIG